MYATFEQEKCRVCINKIITKISSFSLRNLKRLLTQKATLMHKATESTVRA
jgi:hypothetical protein